MTATHLRRLTPDEDGMPRYLHPNGYVIVKECRAWSERVGAMRGASFAGPLTWWSVFDHAGTEDQLGERFIVGAGLPWRDRGDHRTLAEAREWCDAHPRKGWNGR